MTPDGPETLAHAVDRLTAAGYHHEFVAREHGLRTLTSDQEFGFDQLVVDEVVRFEGVADPDDQAILCAVRTRDFTVKGTYVAPFGPDAPRLDAQALRALQDAADA